MIASADKAEEQIMQQKITLPPGQQIHGKEINNMPELIRLQLGKIGIELETIPRWEDDGGQTIQTSQVSG